MKKTIIAAILAAASAGSAFAASIDAQQSCYSVAQAIDSAAPAVFSKNGLKGLSEIKGMQCRDGYVHVFLVSAGKLIDKNPLFNENPSKEDLAAVQQMFKMNGQIEPLQSGKKLVVTEASYDAANKREVRHETFYSFYDNATFIVYGGATFKKDGSSNWER